MPENVKRLGENPFLDSYVMEFLDLPNEFRENDLRKALIKNMKDFILEFLNLPEPYKEYDLQKAILKNMKKFLLEFGRDFLLVDEEYHVQVGNDDYYVDLLFYYAFYDCPEELVISFNGSIYNKDSIEDVN